MIAKYDTHAIPEELRFHLVRFHDISEGAASDAAGVFLSSAKFAGVLNESNILNVVGAGSYQYAEVIPPDSTPIQLQGQQQYRVALPSTPELEKAIIRLSEGKTAQILYPLTMNAKDIQIIKKQLEIIEIVCGIEKGD